jgi:hypothetical protein
MKPPTAVNRWRPDQSEDPPEVSKLPDPQPLPERPTTSFLSAIRLPTPSSLSGLLSSPRHGRRQIHLRRQEKLRWQRLRAKQPHHICETFGDTIQPLQRQGLQSRNQESLSHFRSFLDKLLSRLGQLHVNDTAVLPGSRPSDEPRAFEPIQDTDDRCRMEVHLSREFRHPQWSRLGDHPDRPELRSREPGLSFRPARMHMNSLKYPPQVVDNLSNHSSFLWHGRFPSEFLISIQIIAPQIKKKLSWRFSARYRPLCTPIK